MSRDSTVASIGVPHKPGASVAVEVRIAWMRCERCERVFTAAGDTHDDLDDLKADAADNAAVEFDSNGREVCGDCAEEMSDDE